MVFVIDRPTTREADCVSVGEAADLAGVTVRTLHHWDEIGLASPSVRTSTGYRQYTDADLYRLDRIITYREAGLGLEAIREVLDDKTTEIGSILREQRARLAERMRELQVLDERLERLAEAHEHGIPLSDEVQHEIFGDDWNAPRARQARVVYGGSLQWAQFAERAATRTREQWRDLSNAMSALQLDMGEAVDGGVLPGSPEADALVERHREIFSNFFPLTRRMQVCLGRMFEADPGFAAHYNGVREGLTVWFRESIDASARANGIDPEAAIWE